MNLIRSAITALTVIAAASLPAAAANLNTASLFQLPLGTGVAEVCAAGDYAYVARGEAGIEVVRIKGPGAPAHAGTIRPYPGTPNIDIEDVEIAGNILYAGNEVPNGSPTPHTGLFMYDLGTDPVNPPEVGNITWGAGPAYHFGASVHNFCINEAAGRTYAYVASVITSTVHVFDVTNPAVPEYKDELRPPLTPSGFVPGSAHDVAVRDGLCVSTWLGGGFAVHDVSNIAASHIDFQREEIVSATSLLNYTPYAGAYTFHAAFSEDGRWLVTTDGRTTTGCRTWDLQSITAPGVPLVPVSQFTTGTSALMHNVCISGRYVYLSHFLDGCRILDLRPDGHLVSVGSFDTTPTLSGAGSSGTWGVFVAGETVLLSDTLGGLYGIDFRDALAVTKAEWKQSRRTLTVEATSTAAGSVDMEVVGYGPMTWNANAGKFRLVLTGVNVNPGAVTVRSGIGGTRSSSVRRR